jgi:glycosyltransferase involved in cell wall biosynthesis
MCNQTDNSNKPEPSETPPLRVLQIIPSLNPEFGGPPEGAAQICRSLRDRGIEADIATLDPPGAQWGCVCSVVQLGPSRFGRYSYSDRLFTWLQANAHRYSGVIVHGLWQYHGLATWRALRATGVPYFVFPHGMLDPWFKHTYPLKHFKKQLYWPWAEYRVLRDATAVLFTTEEERQLARQSFGLYRAKEAVVGYGIADPPDTDPTELRAAFLQQHPELQGKRIVLFLGRLDVKKGCDLLIDAFASLAHRDPALHLVMAGPDLKGYGAELVRQAGQRGIASRICWTGMLKGAGKWGAFYSAEVFALPSHQENFGISVAEALACRVPVLISNKVNIWREVAAERAGFVADDTLAGTTGLLSKWLDLPATEREAMSQDGLACFRKHFHIDSSAERLMTTLRSHACPPAHSSAA